MDLLLHLPAHVKRDARFIREATLHVTVQRKVGRSEWEEIRNETVRLMQSDITNIQNPAYVGVNPRLTKNLGNYESLQVGVMVTLPCAPDEESIKATLAKATEIAMNEIEKNMKLD